MAVATGREYGLFIGGELVEPASGDVRELVEPASGAPLAKAAMGGDQDVDRAVEAARAALAGPWGKTPANERGRLLHALADAFVANRKELAELEARNVGKAISSVKAEIAQGVENFRFYGSAVSSIAGRSNPIGGSLLAYSLKQPVGVAGQIVPWNYPLMLATWKLAPALAAGCAVVLKPDAATPVTALRLAELAAEVGFPPGVVNVVPGDGPTTGAYLVRHPGVDKVAFTGSTATGSEVMRLCADPIKRLTLELGGKSPNIVFADADLDSAIPSSVWAIYYSAGQSCEARSRVLVEAPLYDEFVARFSEYASRVKVGDPLDPETQMGSLISTTHREKVHRFVEGGVEEGAEVVTGGEPRDGAGAFYPPTVLAGVTADTDVWREETFGPVAPVRVVADFGAALGAAADDDHGLAATVLTADMAHAQRAWRELPVGTVKVNDVFGGAPGGAAQPRRRSGSGYGYGPELLDEMTTTKVVHLAPPPR